MAKVVVTLLGSLLKYRGLSMLAHSHSYPYKLAGLLHTDPGHRRSTLRTLQRHWEAFQQGSQGKAAVVADLVRKSPFRISLMSVVVAHLEANRWEVRDELTSWLREVWDGFGQTKVIEDANKLAREHETRDQSSRSVRRLKRWSLPSIHGLLTQYQRLEVENNSIKPTKDDPMHLFAPPAHQGDHIQPLNQIRSVATWPTLTPADWNLHSGDIAAITYLHETHNWGKAGELWHASLVPVQEVVVSDESEGKPVYSWVVMVSTDVAALTWPMERHGGFLHLAVGGTLNWVPALHSKLRVLPTAVVSPMHVWAGDRSWPSDVAGVCWKILGEPMGVLNFHAERAFAGIKMDTMNKVLASYGVTKVEEHLPEAEVSTENVGLLLTKLVKGTVTLAELEEALQKRRDWECATEDPMPAVPDEALEAVMLGSDSSECKQWSKHAEDQQRQRSQNTKPLQKVVQTLRPSGAASSSSTGAGQSSLPASRQPQKAAWRARVQAEDAEVLQEMKPPGCTISANERKGAYLIQLGAQRRSVSWTMRGVSQAMLLTLQEAWRLHGNVTGEPCPYDLEENLPGTG